MSPARTDAEAAQALRAALRKRCPAPQWAFMEEVRDRVGRSGRRSADAIAMSTWEGRGLELHGFELKASRGDWIRERDNPRKAETISMYCDRWWLVAADDDLVLDGELPPSWGLLVLRGKSLVTKTPAPTREATPVNRAFLAAMLRRATEMQATLIHPKDIADRIEAEVDSKLERMQNTASWELKELRAKAEVLKGISEALGVPLSGHSGWELPNIAKAYEITSRLDRRHGYLAQLEHTVNAAEATAKSGREQIAKLAELGITKDGG